MNETTLTHKDLADMLGVSVTTIKSYRTKFPGALPVASRGKPIRFLPGAGEICTHIRQGFLANRPVEDIRQSLVETFGVPVTSKGREADGREPARPDQLRQLQESLDLVQREQQAIREGLAALEGRFEEFLALETAKGNKEMNEIQRLASSLETLAREGKTAGREPVRRVRIRDASGRDTVYSLDEDKGRGFGKAMDVESSGLDATVKEGDKREERARLRELPLVVRTDRNEFLGVAGSGAGPFGLEDFKNLLETRHPEPRSFAESVEGPGRNGRMRIRLNQEEAIRPAVYELVVENMLTPKGNEVSVLVELAVNGEDVPPANLFAVIKNLKDGRMV